MSAYTIVSKSLQAGLWTVLVKPGNPASAPKVAATHQGNPVAGVEVTPAEEKGLWTVQVPVRASLLSDGVHTVLLVDTATDTTLDKLVMICGEDLSDDIRAEVDLLRAELDMLKRAFRRHCLETQ